MGKRKFSISKVTTRFICTKIMNRISNITFICQCTSFENKHFIFYVMSLLYLFIGRYQNVLLSNCNYRKCGCHLLAINQIVKELRLLFYAWFEMIDVFLFDNIIIFSYFKILACTLQIRELSSYWFKYLNVSNGLIWLFEQKNALTQ